MSHLPEAEAEAQAQPAIARWSTSDVPSAQRLDYWVSALDAALIPLYVANADRASFESQMSAAPLGPLSVVRQSGAAHDCGRGSSELARSGEHCFNLVMSLNCRYGMTHRKDLRMAPGDLALLDSEYPVHFKIHDWYEFVNLAIPAHWLRTWVADPACLVGRRIDGATPWGKALSSFVALLAPTVADHPPLSPALMSDHLGALLALAANEVGGQPPKSGPAERSLRERIVAMIGQRCQEPSLTAEDLASSLGISVRTLHRALAAGQASYGALLIDERARCGVRMLESPIFRRLTIAEIGRRAGFSDASHFTRVVRRKHGRTPQQLRVQPSAAIDSPPEP